MDPVDVVTDCIIGWVYTDSLVDLAPRRNELRRAVAADMAESGHRMSTGDELECDAAHFVCAEASDPRLLELKRLYPRTDALLEDELS